MDIRWANEELANKLVEVTHLCDESADWACGGAAMAWINSNRYVALEGAMKAAVELVQPMGSSLHEQALNLPTQVRAVTAHGVLHGAVAALAATHLRLQPGVDLRAMAHVFPSRAKVPEDINVGWLIAGFGIAASTIAAFVNLEQVIKDTPR